MSTTISNDLSSSIGQSRNIEALKIEISGALMLRQPLRDLLLIGASGLGKTTLAQRIAAQMGVEFHVLCATQNLKVRHLFECIRQMQPFGILFMDEIHVAAPVIQEALCRVMTERMISGFEQDALTKRWKQVDDASVAPISIIGATDRPGLLQKALISRFGAPVAMQTYSLNELKGIIRVKACQLNLLVTDAALLKIAETCSGIPREAVQRLDVIHKFAAIGQFSEITPDVVQKCLDANGLTESGLGSIEQRYLQTVSGAGASGERLITLQAELALDAAYIQKFIEPKLIHLGLIKVAERRHITMRGLNYVARNFK